MRRTAAVVALVAALSLTGCSMPLTGTDRTGAGTAAETSTGPLTLEEAADQFQQIAAPYDGVLSQFEEAADSGAPLEQQTGLASAVAASLRAKADGLHKVAWPDEVFDDAHALATTVQQEAGHWEEAASAGSEKEIKGLVKTAMEVDDDGTEASIRETLGLPDAGADM